MAEIMCYHEAEYLDAIVGYETKTTRINSWEYVEGVPILMELDEANKEHRLFGIEVELEFDADKVSNNEADQMEEIEVYSEQYDSTLSKTPHLFHSFFYSIDASCSFKD